MELKDCEFVLVNDSERVTKKCDLQEKIKEILEESIDTEIVACPTYRIEPSVSSDEIIDNFYDNGMIADGEYVSTELTKELDTFLIEWCKKVSNETSGYFNTDFKTFINVDDMVEKIKKELIEEKNK